VREVNNGWMGSDETPPGGTEQAESRGSAWSEEPAVAMGKEPRFAATAR
jgi:hypothetical protein